MPSESLSEAKIEIDHVSFIDLVNDSKLLLEQQKEGLHFLAETVLATPRFREPPNEQLVRLPTGDRMALVFRNRSEKVRNRRTNKLRKSGR